MANLIRLLLLTLSCWHVACENLKDALKRRSEAYLVYANDYADQYEPVATAYAAIPLHPPLPVIHMLSAKPLTGHLASSPLATNLAPVYQQPYIPHRYQRPHSEYQSLYSEYQRPHITSDYARPYAPQFYPVSSATERHKAKASDSEILYAKPDKYGGYTYIKKINVRKPAKRVKKRTKPVILRIHKYRIIRDK